MTPHVTPTTAPLSHSDHTHLELVPWVDEEQDRHGHDPRSAYVERFWLGVLGPSAVWFLRLARRELDAASDTSPAVLDLEATARQLGLGHRGGRHSPLMRSIDRCRKFGMVRMEGPGTLGVRIHLPPVPRHLQVRLPEGLREEIRHWLDTDSGQLSPAALRAVAAALMQLGLSLHESAERLTTWGIGIDEARRAAAWAWSTHKGRRPRDQPPMITTS